MKKTVVLGLLLSLLLPLFSQVDESGIEPKIPVKPSFTGSNTSFSMIMVGDPQSCIWYSQNQPLFELQLAWIVKNKEKLKVLTTLMTGDYVEQNNKVMNLQYDLKNVNGDQTSEEQWQAVSRALEKLDGKVPYVGCQGNHDVGYVRAENHLSEMSKYFYPSRNPLNEEHLVAMGKNVEGKRTMENAAYEFNTDTWGDLLIVALEFAPRDEAINWASELISSPKYANHRVILLVHSFMNEYKSRPSTAAVSTDRPVIYTSEGYSLTPRNWGQDLLDKLVKPSHNIVLILCGHSGNPPAASGYTGDNFSSIDFSNIEYWKTCSFRDDLVANDGHSVPAMMFNAQAADGDWRGNGGDGWLRILEFQADGQTIYVQTFSPFFACSKLTQRFAKRTAAYDQFHFTVPRLNQNH